jgi:hypothetical protein
MATLRAHKSCMLAHPCRINILYATPVEQNEVDGVALLAAADSELLELGFDPVSVRKLRSKIESIGHDHSAEQRVADLAHFLRSSGLGHLRDRLMNQLGVFDRDELPVLIGDKKWVKSIGLSVADEIKFKR